MRWASKVFRMWLDVDNCWLDRRVVYLDANGEASFRAAGGPESGADCILSPRYFNELEAYQPPNNRPVLRLATVGYAASELLGVPNWGTEGGTFY